MSARICIHGHFYQPPRENPWTGQVPHHPEARPWRDWNLRVLAQCYGPVVGQTIGGRGRTRRSAPAQPPLPWMSFDFGPTLLDWLEHAAPQVSQAIYAADQESQAFFGGHGPSMAHTYNHLLLPLAPRRDKELQVAWGLRDFRRRFGRDAEAFWLPETAVDLETLETVAAAGVRLVILAPHQARRIRPNAGEWLETPDGQGLDCGQPWTCKLPSGLSIACFFYDGPLSRTVCGPDMPANGVEFAAKLSQASQRASGRLILVASDGEFYGHHNRSGAHVVAQALATCREQGPSLALPTQILAEEGPVGEVQIAEGTSWSCPHGIERWRGHCGCRAGAPAAWSQAWKAPLREAFSWLREQAAEAWTRQAPELFEDPGQALLAAVDLFPEDSSEHLQAFLGAYGRASLDPRDAAQARHLLQAQRLSLFSLTSCAFFFDDLAGIETVQNMRFAIRTVELLAEVDGLDRTAALLERLAPARGNGPEMLDGAALFRKLQPDPRD